MSSAEQGPTQFVRGLFKPATTPPFISGPAQVSGVIPIRTRELLAALALIFDEFGTAWDRALVNAEGDAPDAGFPVLVTDRMAKSVLRITTTYLGEGDYLGLGDP